MSVYGCSYCREKYGRMSNLSTRGCRYIGCGIPTNYGGCFGCRQCARCLCAMCVAELGGKCSCGGQLEQGVRYEYDGDNRLPESIASCLTTDDRLIALDELRRSKTMIQGEYEHLRAQILSCEEKREVGKPLPVNDGIWRIGALRKLYDRGVITDREVVNKIWNSVVPQNVDEILEIMGDELISGVKSHFAEYPTTEDDWLRFTEARMEFEFYQYLIPYRSAAARVAEIRNVVMLIRAALGRRKGLIRCDRLVHTKV